MLTRTLGKLVRGKSSPLQLQLACILSSMLAFIPEYGASPFFAAFLAGLLLIANANLTVAALVFLPARLVALLATPFCFATGRFLLDGPTSPLFEGLINAPLTAWLGLEVYATTGGALVGLVFGILAGRLVVRLLAGLRAKLSKLDHDSEAYKRINGKLGVRMLRFVFFGGKRKKSWEELAAATSKNPVRPVGVVVVAVAVGAFFVASSALFSPILTSSARDNLAVMNGATVDLDALELDLSGGRLTLRGLAFADPAELGTDILRAGVLEADLAGSDFSRRRFALERVVIENASQGSPRETRGELVRALHDEDEAEEEGGDEQEGGPIALDTIFEEWKEWKDRLAQVSDWMEALSQDGEDEETPAAESLRERLEREVRELGYGRVEASHLVKGAPTVLVKELRIGGIRSSSVAGDSFDIDARYLSSAPDLLDEVPAIHLKSQSGSIDCEWNLGHGEDSGLRLALRGFTPESLGVSSDLISGGTIDVDVNGLLKPTGKSGLNLPVQITLRNTSIKYGSSKSIQAETLVVQAALEGSLRNPSYSFDSDQLLQALKKAGAAELANQLEAKTDEALDKVRSELEGELGDKLEKVLGDGLGKDLKGALDTKADDVEKRASGFLKGVLGGDDN